MDLKKIISFKIFLLFILSSFAQQVDDELKVLSWNIYFLPGIANVSKQIEKSDKRARAKEIADFINQSDYDIIVFQEAFFNPARRILSKAVEAVFPYQYGPINPSKLSIKTSSGIFVVSKIPLELIETIQYETCNGADCFAKKGAALFEGEFHGNKFQILGTHINAGGPSWIKEEQFKMMRTLLDDFKKLNVPQIVCGDMNTKINDPNSYNFMIKTLGVQDIETNSLQKNTTAKDRSVIDYVFLRPNRTSLHPINKEILWIKSKSEVIEKLNGNLSDHLAVSVSFKW